MNRLPIIVIYIILVLYVALMVIVINSATNLIESGELCKGIGRFIGDIKSGIEENK